MGRKLSGTVRNKVQIAFAGNNTASEELILAIEESLALNDAETYRDLGMMLATATDHTDAIALGLLVGDKVAFVKEEDQIMQTITTDAEFVTAPTVGDLIIAKRPL